MASLTNYKGLSVVTPDPTGAGGLAINNDFKSLVDWSPKSKWDATADPTVSDDDSEDYQVGSLWYNATDGVMKLCTDASTDAAEWVNVPINVAFQSGHRTTNLTINSTTFVATGLSFDVKEDEVWSFDFCLFAKELDTDADLKGQLTTPTGSTGRYVMTNVDAGSERAAEINLEQRIEVNTASNSLATIKVSGMIQPGADGTVELEIANYSSGSYTQEFHSLSYFNARRIG